MIPKATARLGQSDFEGERLRAELARALAGQVVPSDARLLSDVSFTAGQVRDVEHALPFAVRGFFAVNPRTSAPLIYRTVMDADAERIAIRLTHSGASTTLVDLVIW